MTSKWIKEALDAPNYPWDTDNREEVLKRIDKLLRRAMRETDDENLHDAIEKEIKDVTGRTN